ncbi:helix-turn-helix domain-containing protein [Clostridium sp. HV4-5-A1G]|jgi:transcriptional regulator with XRE-family HTH domain|uniref:helix-turn-helix domain-containing protein n=1 Tax=Clostridium sp. HV4-5-A1G TaxID=2004595 RepID=UPI00123AC303|nr:helix-turn-helix transcriptional regulator [Clostridium sp. HV4-5-A1G]KAA8674470.1 helix-turn-helix transcriptional regulator [Clostridium sp. HV4-5-A1G]
MINTKLIKKIRERKGIPIKELAEQTGLSRSYLYQVERGDKDPSLSALKKISMALHVDIYQFFDNDNNSVFKKVVENVQSPIKKKYGNSKSLNQIMWDKTLDIYENTPTLDNVFFKEYNDLKYDKEPSAYFTLFQVLAEIYAMELALKAPRDKFISEREECLKMLQPKLQDCINDLQDYIDAMIKEKFRKVIDR